MLTLWSITLFLAAAGASAQWGDFGAIGKNMAKNAVSDGVGSAISNRFGGPLGGALANVAQAGISGGLDGAMESAKASSVSAISDRVGSAISNRVGGAAGGALGNAAQGVINGGFGEGFGGSFGGKGKRGGGGQQHQAGEIVPACTGQCVEFCMKEPWGAQPKCVGTCFTTNACGIECDRNFETGDEKVSCFKKCKDPCLLSCGKPMDGYPQGYPKTRAAMGGDGGGQFADMEDQASSDNSTVATHPCVLRERRHRRSHQGHKHRHEMFETGGS